MIEEWGERVTDLVVGVEVVSRLFLDEFEEALLWLWRWWILRIEETEDDVDFLPRNPAEPRRYELERGVKGAGDKESR